MGVQEGRRASGGAPNGSGRDRRSLNSVNHGQSLHSRRTGILFDLLRQFLVAGSDRAHCLLTATA
jgi:hypothetical protein